MLEVKPSRKHDVNWFFACGKPWHKKWWIWVVGVILTTGLIAAPFIINYAYMKGLTLKEPNTAFSASDLLSFQGAILTFLGTTFLGLVAYKQNETHNRKQIEIDDANTLTPFLTIDSVSVLQKPKKESELAPFEISHYKVPGKRAVVTIKNIGQGLATRVSYKHWLGKLSNPEDHQKSIDLGINETFTIQVRASEKSVDEIKEIDIEYQNIIGFRYKQMLQYKLVQECEQIGEDDWEDRYFLHIYLMGVQQRIGLKEATTYDKT